MLYLIFQSPYLAPQGLLQREACKPCHNLQAHVVLFKPNKAWEYTQSPSVTHGP